ncbi:ATP-binding protein [Nevskia soli]|uniref:DNA polymerase III subunit n=1 Tax=Nevskia soli TaxID=418856 RepID=UPI0015D7F1D5|nr:DNA polymerase III subunit delta' [Nevskia soli]
MIEKFWGNRHVVRALEGMIAREQITQTMLFSGPEGTGKATLARRFASLLLPHAELIERDDLSLPENVKTIADREKWTADKRNEDPLLFASQADFLTFPPDGPLRQITIAQMRALKERAQFLPNQGKYRVFLIDHIDRANEQAANSLLKILEEPPPYLILIATAENAYDLLPTIRSRSVLFPFSPLGPEDMRAFAAARALTDAERRITLAAGSPGLALTMDLELFSKRRAAMLLLLSVAAGLQPFAKWIPVSESIGRSKNEKMDIYLKLLYELLRDVLLLNNGRREIRNVDVKSELTAIASKFPAERVVRVVPKIDAVLELVRRNIQKVIALDHLLLELSD